MSHEKAADDLAHARFKSDFDKLFGSKPTLRKRSVKIDKALDVVARDRFGGEYAAGDDASRALMRLEILLENMAAPGRAERAEKLAAVRAENATMRKCVTTLQREVAALSEQVAVLGAFRERPIAKSGLEESPIQVELLDAIEGSLGAIAKALKNAGMEVGELAKSPFPAATNFPPAESSSAAAESVSAWSIPPATAFH